MIMHIFIDKQCLIQSNKLIRSKKYLKTIKIKPIGAISCYNKYNERDSFFKLIRQFKHKKKLSHSGYYLIRKFALNLKQTVSQTQILGIQIYRQTERQLDKSILFYLCNLFSLKTILQQNKSFNKKQIFQQIIRISGLYSFQVGSTILFYLYFLLALQPIGSWVFVTKSNFSILKSLQLACVNL